MPYYATSQEWLHQSSLLIEARPSTTRITTTYHIAKPKPRRSSKNKDPASAAASQPSAADSAAATAEAKAPAPRGSLTLKTYDPHSGACLKYRTTKAAEVSRLILSLGRPLGARMAALPLPEDADEVMVDVGAGTPAEEKRGEEVVAPATTAAAGGKGGSVQGQQAGGGSAGGGGGGKGKKKRGKK
ncbi:signal recognition particle 9 kDa protein-domain-containing protein [Hypoxylon sp. FL0543]|nr:signal recognition particle 9 kDa protein-domain-containing protein [Hypoxylon sp. FL0543]